MIGERGGGEASYDGYKEEGREKKSREPPKKGADSLSRQGKKKWKREASGEASMQRLEKLSFPYKTSLSKPNREEARWKRKKKKKKTINVSP